MNLNNENFNIDNCILDIRSHITSNYDEYIWIFKKYEKILNKEIQVNPDNVKAVSTLAMIKCELRKSINTSLKYLLKSYRLFKEKMNNHDFALITTNIAYFYIEECANKENQAEGLLLSAIDRDSTFAQTYYALAILCYGQKKYEKALPLFEKSKVISPIIRNIYNYAICLYLCGRTKECIEILKEISTDWENHEYKAKSYFALGFIYETVGEIEKTRIIAGQMLKSDYESFDFSHFQIADLMYCINDYDMYVELLDKERLYETSDWLSQYFYCLKMLDKRKVAEDKIKIISKDIFKEIESNKEDPEGWETSELDEYIKNEEKRLDEIKNSFIDVFEFNNKPAFVFSPNLICGCYYIGCPRHYLNDIQDTIIN